MSHLVEQMAYINQPPWHGLGNQLEPLQPMEIWAQQAGMDWEIKAADIQFSAQPRADTVDAGARREVDLTGCAGRCYAACSIVLTGGVWAAPGLSDPGLFYHFPTAVRLAACGPIDLLGPAADGGVQGIFPTRPGTRVIGAGRGHHIPVTGVGVDPGGRHAGAYVFQRC